MNKLIQTTIISIIAFVSYAQEIRLETFNGNIDFTYIEIEK